MPSAHLCILCCISWQCHLLVGAVCCWLSVLRQTDTWCPLMGTYSDRQVKDSQALPLPFPSPFPFFPTILLLLCLLLCWDSECHIWTRPGVLTDQLLKCGRVYYVKADFASEGAGLPVIWRTYGVAQKTFKGEGGTHLYHAFSKYGSGASFLQHQAGVKFKSVNITVELFQCAGLLLVICKK